MAVSRSRLAAALWIAWAVVVWNVVLDQTIVLAGRRYIVAAIAAGFFLLRAVSRTAQPS